MRGILVCLAYGLCGLLSVTVRMTFDLTQKRCPLTAYPHANNIELPEVFGVTPELGIQ